MQVSVAGSRPSPRRCRRRPPAPGRRRASVPASRSGGGQRAGGPGSPAAASLVCSQPIHSGCVTCDGPDVTVTASRTSFRGTSSLRGPGAEGASGARCTGTGAYFSPCQAGTWQKAPDLAKQRTALGSPDTFPTRPGGGE